MNVIVEFPWTRRIKLGVLLHGWCCSVAVQSGKTDPMLPAVPVCSSVFQWPIRQLKAPSISSRSQQLSHPILGATMTSRFGDMLCASWNWCLLMFPWPNSTRGRCNTMEVRQIWRRWRPMHWSLALKGSPFLFHFYQHRRTVHLNKQKDNITNIL